MVSMEDLKVREKLKIKKLSTAKLKSELAKRGYLNSWGRSQYRAELKRRGVLKNKIKSKTDTLSDMIMSELRF